MALATTADYGSAARILLQDATQPYRFPDTDLALALSLALEEAHRLRPELFALSLGTAVPSYTTLDGTAVVMDEQYRMSLVYYMTGWVQLRDDEYTQDGRAAAFINKFTTQLTGMA